MAKKHKPNELYIERIYDAPVKMVWEAWVDPDQVAQWWGPRGFSLTTKSKDVRTGGSWVYTMHGPDGTDYPNIAYYHEVKKYSRMVYDHGATENTPPLFRVTVIFTDLKGKTKMEMTMALATAEAANETKKFIKKAGGDSTWDRLGEYLNKNIHGKDQFIINRSFDAPIEKLFELWTNPEHFSKWLPPTGFRMNFLKADIRAGGETFYCMTSDTQPNFKMYGKAHYIEIVKPTRLVYTQQFCDENGNTSRHPGLPTWPETMLTQVMFTAESAEQTRVTVQWEAYGNFTPAELDVFLKERSGMSAGWTGSFDKLENLIQS